MKTITTVGYYHNRSVIRASSQFLVEEQIMKENSNILSGIVYKRYRAGARLENPREGANTTVVGIICPHCGDRVIFLAKNPPNH